MVYMVADFSKQVKQKVTTTYLLVQSLKEEVTYKFSVKAETIGYGPEVWLGMSEGGELHAFIAGKVKNVNRNKR